MQGSDKRGSAVLDISSSFIKSFSVTSALSSNSSRLKSVSPCAISFCTFPNTSKACVVSFAATYFAISVLGLGGFGMATLVSSTVGGMLMLLKE